MRLHRLTLTAFGPFAAEQSVDFDALSAAGLFLLHGPTGGGKTSVLDAVCFALYGQVPGDRPATRLRSDHAAPGTPTEVVLDLTLGGRRLEITRRPEQPRAKKRGSGTTTERAVTLLREHIAGEWRALSKSHQEAGEEIRQLVGMSCEQFCQVVLLPQGEFATFLRAGATERAALLGRLFDTRRFRSVEHRLRDDKLAAAGRLADGDRRIADVAARMRQAAGEPGPEAESGSEGGFGLLADAALLRCTARERHDIARAALARAEAVHAEAAAAAREARERYALRQRHEQALRHAAALAAEAPARAAARAALTRARRATTVDPALTRRDKAAAQHAEALAAEHTAALALSAAGDLALAVPPQPPGGAGDTRGRVGARYAAGTGGAGAARRLGRSGGEERPGGGEVPGGPGAAGAPVRPGGEDAPGDGDGTGAAGAGEAPGGADGRRYGAGVGVPVRPGGEDAPGDGDGTGAAGAGGPSGADFARGRGGVPGAREEAGGTPQGGAGSREGLRADVLERRAGELREVLGGLGAAAEAEARMRDVAARRQMLEREERDDEEAVRDADGWLAGWPRERAVLQAGLDAGQEAAARAAALAAELAAARQRRDAAARRDTLAAELDTAEQAARAARDHAADAREAWQDLRESRISGIAAELAAGLSEGEPCRVCGSAEHPAPARPVGRHVTRADEDAAYARFQRRTAAYDTAREAAARLGAALEAATAAAGPAPYAELAALHGEAAAAHAAAVRAAAGVPEARAALARAEEERDRRTAQQQEAQRRAAARTSRREELDEQYERLSGEVARARAGYPSVAARRERLSAAVALLDRAAHAARDRADSEERLAEAQSALAEAAARAGFRDAAEAAATLLPPSRLRAAEGRAEAWDREEAAARAAVEAAAQALDAAAGVAPESADPAAAEAELEAAGQRLRRAAAEESAAATRCAELDRLGLEAAAFVRELAPARTAYERLARLSDLVSATSAENRFRMELETYVLAARLEQVAAAAGVRLQRMSGGRYTLVHSDARGGGRAKSGLGLVVVDAWTGTERDTSTLSGGETFYASLALALGLADVVTDEAGGMRLDTLFIDEGFGSLDEQALDEVLDVLDGLRERDRAVGIVSHVADLRDRIPARLRVSKGRDGSTLHQRTA
ncbi:AAA family ATPase [Streptomyces sp. NRRL F-5123]|uniref:AAA family ATPase n=1 Tax=Streptomyces sp. NRRL F-5123 TaxID=1463856 RepID=UPI0004E140E8|nr:SMC family ATPase [Streptomyces sp. NRRL F-5123]